MKTRILLAVFAAVAMVGCSNEEPTLIIQSDEASSAEMVFVKNRTVEEAVEIANQLAEMLDNEQSRGKSRIATGMNSVQIIGSPSSRSGELADTLLYVVSYDNGNGYAIISAPEHLNPLIGLVENGEFATLSTAENSEFQFYMDAAKNYVKRNSHEFNPDAGNGFELTPAFTDVKRVIQDRVEPKLTVEWGQGFPEGYFCPNKISGCVQTATVQVMSYFEQPKSLELTYPGRDKDLEKIYWPQTKGHVQSSNLTNQSEYDAHFAQCPGSTYVHYALGRLCREIGYRNNANYKPASTGVSISPLYSEAMVAQRYNLAEWLPNQKVSGFRILSDYVKLYDELKSGGIVMFNGIDDNAGGGHAWVADGAFQQKTITTRTYSYNDPFTGRPHVVVMESFQNIFHFNWGWNGNSNGYFDAGVFAPDNKSQHPAVADKIPGDLPSFSRGYDFSDYVEYCVIK